MSTILITGAAGRIGTAITPLLRGQGHLMRLLDLEAPPDGNSDDEVILGNVTDESLMNEAASGVDLVVHLAGHPSERPWQDLVELNIESARVVLEAARHATVPVTVMASSIHAAGFTPWDAADARVVPARPDTFYGVSKVVGEALGSVYADRFGLAVVSARIMTFGTLPHNLEARGTWLSPADCARMVLAVRSAPPGHHIIWGVSANTRCPVSLEAGRALGYEPRDDAEDHLDQLARRLGYADPSELPEIDSGPLGTEFAHSDHPLGVTW